MHRDTAQRQTGIKGVDALNALELLPSSLKLLEGNSLD